MIATHDPFSNYTLHQLDPSGAVTQYHGTASGRGKQAAKSEIEKIDFKSMSYKEAIDQVAKILLTCSEETKDKK